MELPLKGRCFEMVLNNRVFVFGIILILMALLFTVYSYNAQTLTFITPDETINYAFSLLYKDTGSLAYYEELNQVSDNIIRPRGVLVNEEQKLVPAKFVGFPIYYGTFAVITGNSGLLYLTHIFSILGLTFIYILGRNLFGKREGLISIFLLSMFPPYWYWSNFPLFENVFASVVFILSINFYVRFLQSFDLRHGIIASMFLGVTFSVRPDTAIFLILPMGVLALAYLKKRWGKVLLKYIFLYVLIFLLVITPFLMWNKWNYGGYLKTGITLQGLVPMPGLIWNKENSVHVLFTNLNLLISSMTHTYFILLLLGVLSLLLENKWNLKKVYTCLTLISILIFSIHYLTGFPPKREIILHESYNRYFLPIYLMSIPIVSSYTVELKNLPFKKVIVPTYIAIMIVLFSTLVVDNLEPQWKWREGYEHIREQILSNTENNSVILIWGLDKIIYPERRVAIINFIHDKDLASKMCEITVNLTKKGIPVYIYRYGPFNFNKFNKKIVSKGLKLIRVDNKLYKIIKS